MVVGVCSWCCFGFGVVCRGLGWVDRWFVCVMILVVVLGCVACFRFVVEIFGGLC